MKLTLDKEQKAMLDEIAQQFGYAGRTEVVQKAIDILGVAAVESESGGYLAIVDKRLDFVEHIPLKAEK